MKNFWVLVCILFIGCGRIDGESPPDKIDQPSKPLSQLIEQGAQFLERLEEKNLHGPYVVSRHPNGRTEHEGEAILYSGILYGLLPCGHPLAERLGIGLSHMIMRHDGAMVRFEPLGEYEGGREITLDGAIGLYYGIIKRYEKCAREVKDQWSDAMGAHFEYLRQNDGELYPGTDVSFFPELNTLPQTVASLFGRDKRPHRFRVRALQAELYLWSLGVRVTKAPCYRVHLAWLMMESMRLAGFNIENKSKERFCSLTEPMDMPTIDGFCGRKEKLHQYLSTFKLDEWEYRAQRCGAWETPDGKGLTTPGLDYQIALDQFIGLN